LLNNADVALRQAKQRGPNTIRFFTPSMHEEILSQYRLEADLKSAVKQGQFVLLYQPQLRLADHRIEAVEAKLHWNNAQRAPVTANELAVAEQTGCVIPMGMWAIEEVCRLLGQLGAAGVPLPRVGINVAAAQFRQPDFPATLHGVLGTYSIDPELIELEISELALMENPEASRDRLYALRDIGVRLAVDDFGAGKSCFSHLQQFPLDVLKVGSSFVTELDKSKDAQIVCTAILSVARGFSLDVVADGVTSEQQEAFFARHDCLYGQGPYFGAPIEADQVGAKMAESGAKSARRRRVVKKRVGMRAG
jgi:EAL domain-containing protein (putative c-di-GMP-specific phosphodiesterase class I)